MGQFYTDPERAYLTRSLPNAETFYVDKATDDFPETGWYWWPCFPGCLPDGEPMGPFETEQDAIADAQEEG